MDQKTPYGPQNNPKPPFPFGDVNPQMASRSNQLFCHNVPDRQTDGTGNKTSTNTRLYSIDCIVTQLIIIALVMLAYEICSNIK